jgi:HNH endonuclease
VRGQAATEAALRAGALSIDQASLVSDAVAADPAAESQLLATAGRETLRTLRERSHAVQTAAADDRVARHERQRACRAFRHGIDRDGMVWGHFRLPPDTGGGVVNRVERETDREFRRARREGRHEAHEQYAADALVAVVTGTASPGAAVPEIVVHVSHGALRRGRVEPGEVCLIEGFGDIPVDVAREILADAFLKGVLVDGTRVETVRHYGRHIPATVRTALHVEAVARDGTVVCAAEGCDRRASLEWDHIEPHAHGGPTEIANLQPLCRHHHQAKTRATTGPAPAHPPP